MNKMILLPIGIFGILTVVFLVTSLFEWSENQYDISCDDYDKITNNLELWDELNVASTGYWQDGETGYRECEITLREWGLK